MRARLLVSLVAVVLSACATSPTGRSQFLLISPQAAIAQSEPAYFNALADFRRQGKLLDNPVLGDRIRVISGRLVGQAVQYYPHTARWEWSVALIDDPNQINAWCMAGGRMAIYSGIIHKLRLSDDEIAQIMGHEISHAIANHTAERMSIAIAQGLTVAVIQASTENSAAGDLANFAASIALSLPNSRAGEAEADELGLRLATLAGYNPDAAVTLWQKMQQYGGPAPPEFLSTHPSAANRIERLAAMAASVRPMAPSVPPAPHDVRVYP